MKRLLFLICLCSASAMAADLTSPVNTPNSIIYNMGFRDVKDGTNAQTFDAVVVDTYAVVTTTATIKATGGYIDNVFITNYVGGGCIMTYPVQVWDNTSAAGGNFIVRIGTTAAVGSISIPVHARFGTGLTVGVDAFCANPPAVNVSYR